MDLEARWRAACDWVRQSRDIIDERPETDEPAWVKRRGWGGFLASLDAETLARCEIEGLAVHAAALGAPPDLCALAEGVLAVGDLAPLGAAGAGAPTFRVGARKRRQVAAFAAVVAPRVAGVGRVVDVGAGHGHLTRHLAEALHVEALGLERDPVLVQAARALADASTRFEAVDLFAGPPALGPDDLVVGLHACGELSDRLVQHAAAVGAAVAFASCCMHKRTDAARAPLYPGGGDAAALTIERHALGLANIALGAEGVEASQQANVRARGRRAALRALLRRRGVPLARPGDEMRGLNRRWAHKPFPIFAAEALARRHLRPATAEEVAGAEAEGRLEDDRARRWTVARRMLGRLLEIQINADRAMYLRQRGYTAEIGTLWPRAASPRNVGVIAQRR